MLKTTIAKPIFAIATLAMMFSAAPVQAQAEKSGTAAAPATAGASAKGSGAVGKKDQRMMRNMAYSNLAEIETAKLALSKTQNEQVKAFAQKMIDDHTKAQQDLQQVAQSKGVTLPAQPDATHQAMAKKLSALSGDAFDRLYMAQGGLADHKKTHRLLQRAQSGAADPDLKALATKTQPVVDEHLSMAQQLQGGKADVNKATSTSDNRAVMAPATSGGSIPGAGTASSGSGK